MDSRADLTAKHIALGQCSADGPLPPAGRGQAGCCWSNNGAWMYGWGKAPSAEEKQDTGWLAVFSIRTLVEAESWHPEMRAALPAVPTCGLPHRNRHQTVLIGLENGRVRAPLAITVPI